MAVARKIAYNVAFSSASKVLSTILALVSIGFITRYLGKEGFGSYATVLAFLSFFTAFFDLGLYTISTREISRPGADAGKIISHIFSLRIVTSLFVLIVAPIVVFFFPYPREVKEGILIIAAAFLFSSTYQILIGVFQKNLAMDKVSLSELLGKVIQVGAIIAAIKLKLGFNWIMASILLNMIASFIMVYFWSKKYIRLKLSLDVHYWKGFLRESLPMGISALIVFVYFKIDTILLSLMQSSAEVGIYNVAYKVIENITFFPGMIVGLIMPIMAQNVFHNKERFKDISDKTFKVFIVMVIPLVVATLFLSGGIVRLIGGAGFADSAGTLRVLIFSLAFIFFGSFFNAIMVAANLQKKLMYILGLAAVFNVTLNIILIPKFSYMGAAYVAVFTELFVAAAVAYFVIKNLGYFPRVEKASKLILSGIIMAVFLFVFRNTNFFLQAVGSTGVYAASLWIFKVIATEEIKSLISKKGVSEYEPL
jgi:O-antigen/teichoic acid export membrane protein